MTLSLDCLLYYCFFVCFFPPTSIHIVDTFLFTIILGCVCFKMTHNFVFNTNHRFLWSQKFNYLTNQASVFCKCFLFDNFFSFKFIYIIYRKVNGFKNNSSICLLNFISLFANSLPSNSLKF